MASEEMSFENVIDDDGQQMSALYYKLTYEPLAQVSYPPPPLCPSPS